MVSKNSQFVIQNILNDNPWYIHSIRVNEKCPLMQTSLTTKKITSKKGSDYAKEIQNYYKTIQSYIQNEKPTIGWKNTIGSYYNIHNNLDLASSDFLFCLLKTQKELSFNCVRILPTEYFDGKCDAYFRGGTFK